MEGYSDISELVNEFVVILGTGPTLFVLARLDALAYDPMFMRLLGNDLQLRSAFIQEVIQVLPELGEVVRSFLDQLLQIPGDQTSPDPCTKRMSVASQDSSTKKQENHRHFFKFRKKEGKSPSSDNQKASNRSSRLSIFSLKSNEDQSAKNRRDSCGSYFFTGSNRESCTSETSLSQGQVRSPTKRRDPHTPKSSHRHSQAYSYAGSQSSSHRHSMASSYAGSQSSSYRDSQVSESGREAVAHLRSIFYWILSSITADSEHLCVQLSDAWVPVLIGQDISQLQPVYNFDKTCTDIVSNGLAIINNCSLTHSLLPTLREQVLGPVMSFVDPDVNHVNMVLRSIAIVRRLNPENKLHECYFPESFFQTLSDLLKGLNYDEEYQQYWTQYSDGEGGRHLTAAGNVLDILSMLARANHYKCRLSVILNENSDKISDLLVSPYKEDKARTKRLIHALVDHRCGACSGTISLALDNTVAPTIDILEGVLELATDPQYQCQLLCYLHIHREKVDQLLYSEGSEEEEELLQSIVFALKSHYCPTCGGAFYFLVKHGIQDDEDNIRMQSLLTSTTLGTSTSDVRPETRRSRTTSTSEPTLATKDSILDVKDTESVAKETEANTDSSLATSSSHDDNNCNYKYKTASDDAVFPASTGKHLETGSYGYMHGKNLKDAGISSSSSTGNIAVRQSRKAGKLNRLSSKKGSKKLAGSEPILDTLPGVTSHLREKSYESMDSIIATGQCSYMQACNRFLNSINVSAQYIEGKQTTCYCHICMPGRGEGSLFFAGKPTQKAATPAGWVKFPIRAPVRAEVLQIWEKWHIGYHGTDTENIAKILATGELLMPGDMTQTGEVLSTAPGHYTKNKRPAGFDLEQFFMSPSIIYASQSVYSTSTSFEDKVNKTGWIARVVFQGHIQPNSYTTSHQTTRKNDRNIDPLFHNAELEWSTKCRGVIILTAILVKLEPQDDDSTCVVGKKKSTVKNKMKTSKPVFSLCPVQ
eukprot:GHVU01236377.1.p1 GENE.GHVU01236377.1~~GHVU01236377.1.p1  ORF type:complete len:987 (-),score=102.67 GHVU01236377.1:334-3294(-)